jgi:SAM-dependent methyltransferase
VQSSPLATIDVRWLDLIDEVARATLGRDDLRGPALAVEVARVSRAYTRDRVVPGALAKTPRTSSARAARLRFFLPRDLGKVGIYGLGGPLDDLYAAASLPSIRTWRVLDVGAGLGAASLGVAAFARASGAADALDVTAIDDDPRALAIFAHLAAAANAAASSSGPASGTVPLTVPLSVRTRTVDLGSSDTAETIPAGPFDLIVAGFVLNELFLRASEAEALARRAALVRALCRRLALDGVLLILEPGLRETSRSLHALRDAVLGVAPHAPAGTVGPDEEPAPHVLYPCTHARPCPMLFGDRDWCHDDLPVALPPPLAQVARAAGLRFEGLSFSALAFGRRPRVHVPGAFRVVSDVLRSKGKREAYVCGVDGRVRLDLLDRDVPRGAPDPLGGLRRGATLVLPPLAFEGGDEGAPVRRARLRP